MIISPPFLPAAGLGSTDADANPPVLDLMMDKVDAFELAHGIYPIGFDRRWHCGAHLMPSMQNEKVRAIADGEVVAYRVCQKAYDGGGGKLRNRIRAHVDITFPASGERHPHPSCARILRISGSRISLRAGIYRRWRAARRHTQRGRWRKNPSEPKQFIAVARTRRVQCRSPLVHLVLVVLLFHWRGREQRSALTRYRPHVGEFMALVKEHLYKQLLGVPIRLQCFKCNALERPL